MAFRAPAKIAWRVLREEERRAYQVMRQTKCAAGPNALPRRGGLFDRLRTWKQRVVRAEIGLPRRCVSFSRKIFAKANLFWEPCIRGSCRRRVRAIPLPPRRRRVRVISLPPRHRRVRAIPLPPRRRRVRAIPLSPPRRRVRAIPLSPPCLRSVASLMPLPRARLSSPPCPSVLAPVPVCPRPRARLSSPLLKKTKKSRHACPLFSFLKLSCSRSRQEPWTCSKT